MIKILVKVSTHHEGDGPEHEDGEDGVELRQVGDEGGGHGADPRHRAGEGEGDRADDRGEELAGVEVDDAPAHLGHVLAQHGQHDDRPLVGVDAEGHRGRGHAQQAPDDVVQGEVWSSSKPARMIERWRGGPVEQHEGNDVGGDLH